MIITVCVRIVIKSILRIHFTQVVTFIIAKRQENDNNSFYKQRAFCVKNTL